MIELLNQNQASTNGVTSCSLTMTGCKVGNTLILAYAIRGDGNDPTLTSGWVKLGGGNNVSDVGNSNQRLYFAYKVVTSATESVILTQSPTSRIYMVCSEYSEVTSVVMRDDLTSLGSSNYTVTGSKSNANNVMVYGVTSAYYSSGKSQTVTPTDLVKIEGDSSAERLACWFDGGSGALNHTFRTCDSTEDRDAILECVQLIGFVPSYKYLVKSNGMIYTVTGSSLSALSETELTADLFKTHGVDELPSSDLILTLENPEVLHWTNDMKSTDSLDAVMTATPFAQTLVSNDYDFNIKSARCKVSTDALFAVSFNSGNTWLGFANGAWSTVQNPVMTADVLNAISPEQWGVVSNTGKFRFKVTLPKNTSYFYGLSIEF